MPHVDLMFPNDYIKAADLDGKNVALTISRVVQEDLLTLEKDEVTDKVKRVKKPKWIVYFKEMAGRKEKADKRLVLNKTNGKTIQSLHGGESESWVGKKITLYPTTCLAFGEMVECVRIRGKSRGKR